MKKFILLILFALSVTHSFSQNITAVYSEKIHSQMGITLDYETRLYIDGNRSASYSIPIYLEKYPEGIIEINDEKSVGVSKEPIQSYFVVDLDSAIKRVAQPPFKNEYNTFEMDIYHWEIFPEVRYINGLKCQRATYRRKISEKPYAEIWFTQEVPITLGIMGLHGVPGLIVELKGDGYSYSLISYDLTSPIPEGVFWPQLFNKPFSFTGHAKNRINE